MLDDRIEIRVDDHFKGKILELSKVSGLKQSAVVRALIAKAMHDIRALPDEQKEKEIRAFVD